MSGEQQRRRWAVLAPGERQRRQKQSDTDKTQAAAGASGQDQLLDEVERNRRQGQSDASRARDIDDAEEVMYRTVRGGDINFMDKNDW
jgi:hypothetical protein